MKLKNMSIASTIITAPTDISDSFDSSLVGASETYAGSGSRNRVSLVHPLSPHKSRLHMQSVRPVVPFTQKWDPADDGAFLQPRLYWYFPKQAHTEWRINTTELF